MPGTLTVFNLGTSYSYQNNPNSTISTLYNDCLSEKIICDGPTALVPWNAATQMTGNVDRAKAEILKKSPTGVIMVGHSRGAVTCHLLANKLVDDPATQHVQINIFVFDPVNMSTHGVADVAGFGPHMKLNSYMAVIQENEGTTVFPPTIVGGQDPFYQRVQFIQMPGSHGSMVQDVKTTLGTLGYAMAESFLMRHGTKMGNTHRWLTFMAKCDLFAKVILEHPAKYDAVYNQKKGRFTGRGWFSKSGKGLVVGREGLGAPKRGSVIDRVYEKMQDSGQEVTDFRNTPYFLNQYHAYCFKCGFPGLYRLFDNKPVNPAEVSGELDRIEANYTNIRDTFRNLGMLD